MPTNGFIDEGRNVDEMSFLRRDRSGYSRHLCGVRSRLASREFVACLASVAGRHHVADVYDATDAGR